MCADRIAEVLDTETSVPVDRPTRSLRTRRSAATSTSSDVTFAYPGAEEPVLQRRLASQRGPGQTVAIIGSTGAGKTTLVNLVPRLFDVTDGVGARRRGRRARLDPETAVVADRAGAAEGLPVLRHGPQQPAHGKPDATDEELWEALEIAQARDFVEALPEGLDAPVAQGGTNVSGGQRQRLAIARALVRTARDLPLRRLVLGARPGHRRPAASGAAARDPATRPCVIVAQRVSTIRDADLILVLEDGRVVGRGTHDELLADCATYQEIVASQLHGGGGGMSEQAPRPLRQAGVPGHRADRGAPGGPGRGPMGGGMVGQKAMTFGPSAKRLVRRMRPDRGQGRSRSSSSASVSVALMSIGPRILGPRDRPDLRRAHRLATAAPGSPRSRPCSGCATPAGQVRRHGGEHGRRARPGRRLRRGRRRAAGRARDLRRRVAARRGCRATCSTTSCRAPSAGCARTSRTRSTGCRWLLRPLAARRAAVPGHQRHRQRQPDPAADDEPAADLAADRGRRARR